MRNMSIRAILLSAFAFMIIGLVVVVGLGFVALNKSSDGIVSTEHTSTLMLSVSEIEKYILEGISYSLAYEATKDAAELREYQNLSNKAMETVETVLQKVEENKLKNLIQDIKKDLLHYNEAVEESSSRMNSMKNTLLSKLDNLHQEIMKLQVGSIKSTEKIVFTYKSTITIIGIVAIVMGILIASFVANFLVKNLLTIQNAARDLASSDGDLTKRMPVIGKNEVGIAVRFSCV